MGIKDLFKRDESLIAIDIGASSIKVIELDMTGEKPRLLNYALAPVVGDIFSNNVIVHTSKVGDLVADLLGSKPFTERRVVTAVPGPSVFTKKIKMPKMAPAELASNVQFEAGNFIPHNINAVRLDYHVIGDSGKGQLDVLVAAVKNEIIDSFIEAVSLGGQEAAVVDVDCFALQNIFEMSHPELVGRTVALINMGARFSSVNICRGGQSLFTGDIAIGGKTFTEALVEGLGISSDEAEKIKKKNDPANPHHHDATDIINRSVQDAAAELNRQLSFFWNASGSDDGIDIIVLTGGGALVPGLIEELKEKTGLDCRTLDPFKGLEVAPGDREELSHLAPLFAVATGMGIRQPGDRIVPDYQ